MISPWWQHAACKDAPLDLFYGKSQRGIALCRGCPVTQECQIAADQEEKEYGPRVYGIRGNETAAERLIRRGYGTRRKTS
jgi:hypothetical protein